MKKSEAQALLADESQKGAWAMLKSSVQASEDWIIVIGRFEGAPDRKDQAELEADDAWTLIAIHKTAGFVMDATGRIQSDGGARLIKDHGVSSGGCAHQGRAGTLVGGIWLWDVD